jgi:chitodextrinase
LLVVYVIWSNTTGVSITDSRGNAYTSTAAATTFNGGRSSSQVFYAKNITAGANTVTATFATSVGTYGILYVQEYAGMDRNSPLDVTTSATGVSGSTMSSGSIGTTNAGDLLVGAGASSATVTQAGSGYTMRSTGAGNVIEDRMVTTTGSYSAMATHNGTYWVMQLAAFKADPGVADTAPPSVPTNVSASAVSASQINLSWTASTDNVGVTGYRVFRGGTQIGTTSLPSYQDTGLAGGTSYSYAISAYDAAGNVSAQSTAAGATTPAPADGTPPTAPANLTATAVSASQISLSWTASTDNVGVIGYKVFRNGAQVGTPGATTYSDSPLSASTTYSYTVEAVDAAGNASSPSAALGVMTAPAPTGPAYPLKVSAGGRYLVDQTGEPFLLVGDSPQSVIGNLSEAQWATYLADRQAHGFNALWVNLLCASYTYCNANGTTYDGIAPFTSGSSPSNYDLATPNPTYFQRVDDFVALAARYQQMILFDPIETGSFLATLQANGATKAFDYGAYIGNRYKNSPNVIWLNGNDFQSWGSQTDANLVSQVMQGIHSTDTNHLQTIEGPYYSSASADNPTFAARIDLNAAYTYFPTYDEVLHAYNQSSSIPTFMVEANYEFENNTGGDPSTPLLMRMQEYWTMLSGATGQLYGNYYTVRFATNWQSNLDTTGVAQLGYQTQLLRSLPWYLFVPDQNHSVLTAGYGTYSATGSLHTNDYATAARASDGSTVMIYMPTRRTITVDMTKLSGSSVTARWFDPTNGTFTTVNGSPFANSGSMQFTPPGTNAEGSGDWVLLLQGPDTQAPSPPADLTATPRSASRLDLSWTPSTDNGAVAGYEVLRDGAQIATTTGNSYSDTGLAPDTTHTYTVRAVDAAGNISDPSNALVVTTPSPDTAPPSIPTSLKASGVSAQSATVSWAASTDNLGVAGYDVFRNGVQVADTASLGYSDSGLAPSTTYQYTVAAYDFSGNVSSQSVVLPVTTTAAAAANPAFVQLAERTANSSSNTAVTNAFSAPTTTGDTIIVWAWYNSSTQSVTGMSDTAGDAYALAVGPTTGPGALGGWRQEIWYARNITGRTAVTVTATFSGTFGAEKSLTAHEY